MQEIDVTDVSRQRYTSEQIAEASEIRIGERRLGVILFVSRIQGLMDSMNTVQWKLVTVFMIIVIVALVLALIMAFIVHFMRTLPREDAKESG